MNAPDNIYIEPHDAYHYEDVPCGNFITYVHHAIYDAVEAERDELRNMLILCGEPECADVQGYPEKLRALIDGVIDLRREVERLKSEKIVIHESCCCGECKPNERTVGVVSKDEYKAIFDLHIHEKKQIDQLRAEVERLKTKITYMSDVHSETLSDVLKSLGDDAPEENGRKRVIFIAEQLRARLDAACEWVPIAEAEFKHGEIVDIVVGDARYIRMMYCKNPWDDSLPVFSAPGFYFDENQVSHIMRIKPPAGGETKP